MSTERGMSDLLLPNEVQLGVEIRDLNILVLGLDNYPQITEGRGPLGIVELLDRYYGETVPAILSNNGKIDKFVDGGGIIAVFGAPPPFPNPEFSAVTAARSLRSAIIQFNSAGNPVFDFRIAIASGETAIGNIGTEKRLEYTVVGEPLTLARKMIYLAKEFDTNILIDENTYKAVEGQVEVREPHVVVPPGLTQPHVFYPLT